MKKIIPLFYALSVAAVAWPGSPLLAKDSAAPDSSEAMRLFEQIDLDSDGSIDREEAKVVPALDKIFEQMDVNGDGRLSREEFAANKGRSVVTP